jgi:hypothetical protein
MKRSNDMLFKKDNDPLEAIHYRGIEKILCTLKDHYFSCVDLIEQKAHGNIARAANRFIKVERSLINEVNTKFCINNEVNDNNILSQPPALIVSYNDMYQSNLSLISYLKNTIRKFNNQHMSTFFSYWVAALQVENDEIAKHL